MQAPALFSAVAGYQAQLLGVDDERLEMVVAVAATAKEMATATATVLDATRRRAMMWVIKLILNGG